MDRKGIFQMKLNCQSVTKTFQNQTAVDKVSFTLSEPMICGLLGRNGAGKTTLLRMIANRFQPTTGQILLDGQSVWENEQAQRQIFFATEGANFAEMKVRDVIRWMAAAYPNFDKEQCLNYAKQFELDLKKNNLKLSTGYKSVLRARAGGRRAHRRRANLLAAPPPHRAGHGRSGRERLRRCLAG